MKTSKIAFFKKCVIYGVCLLNVLFITLSLCLFYKADLMNEIPIMVKYKSRLNIPYERKQEFLLADAWANSLSKLHIQADVVFYGNSITYDSDFQILFPKMKIFNMGCKGDDLNDLFNRSFVIRCVQPKKIFILGGINKLPQISLEDFKDKYQMMVDTIRKMNPTAQIYLQGMLPVNVNLLYGKQYVDCIDKIKAGNEIINDIATSSGLVYIDLYSLFQEDNSLPLKYTEDGLHINKEAYYMWAKYIERYL